MKSYTDIEQSKRLAEILPIESADCCYFVAKETGVVIPTPGFFDIKGLKKEEKFLNEVTFIPCWSLAALLEVMQKDLGLFHKLTMDYLNTFSYTGWRIGYSNEHWSFKKMAISQNLIDAAYECICQMYEDNLVENDENDV